MNEESSFVDLSSMGIDDVPEVYIMPSGSEVEARVVSAMKKRDKNGTLFIMPFFDVPAEPDVAEFFKYIPLPTEGESEKENNNRKRTLKLFGECFSIDWSQGFEIEEIIGRTGWVLLGVSSSEEYGEQNTVKKFIIQG